MSNEASNKGDEARIAALREQMSARMQAKDTLAAAEAAYELGLLYDRCKRYEEAFDAHLTAFNLRNQLLGTDDVLTNESCYEVGEISRVLHRYEEAEYYLARALDVEGANPRGDDFTAKLFNNLAEVYTYLGRYDDAAPLFDEALRLRVAADGQDGERALRTRVAVARMKLLRGGEARAVLAEAESALDSASGVSRSNWLIVLADARLACGDAEGAIRIYSAFFSQVPATEIGRGISFEVYLDLLRGLLIGYAVGQAWSEVLEAAAALPEIAEYHLVNLLRRSAEVQVGRALGRLLDIQSLWLTALWRSDTLEGPMVEAAFAFVQMMKGLRTRYIRLRQPGNAQVEILHAPQDAARLEQRWSKLRELEDALVQSRLAAADRRSWERDFKTVAWRAQLRSLERESATGVDDLEALSDLRPVGGVALPEATAGIEIVWVSDVCSAHLGGSAPLHRYLGFALASGNPAVPRLVHFGLAVEVDRAAAELRRSLADEPPVTPDARRPAWMRLASFLGKKLLNPCWAQIAYARDLLCAPDGSWAALPLDLLTTPQGQPLGERFTISGCMRLSEVSRHGELIRRGSAPLVLAGPDFDLPHAFTAARGRPSTHGDLAALLPGGGFSGLPAAAEEGAEVGQLLGVEALTGAWALRQELLSNESPELLHIATHGFVLPSDSEDPLRLAAPIGNALQRRAVLDDPLQRCGLVFAGANAALLGRSLPEPVGDGIVYGASVQQLNLQQTDLVYLSACRSGIGELTPGDGIHGLRRAFLAAGCRSVVATLWDVPDVSSRIFSTTFYSAVLAGRSRIDALREARDLLKAQHPHDPLHWAGFVLDGDTGPLRRFSPLADLKLASVNFKRWMASDGEHAKAMDNLAAAIVSVGDRSDTLTVKLLREGIAAAKPEQNTLADLLAQHADLANHLGDNERAVSDYQRAIRDGRLGESRRQAFQYNIAKIWQQCGQQQEAVNAYTALLAELPQPVLRATTLVNRSVAYWLLGDTAAALADVDAVVGDSESPAIQRWMAHVNRAEINAETNAKQSLADVEAALALDVNITATERARVRVFAAALMLSTGQEVRARTEIDVLMALPEVDSEALEYLRSLRCDAGLTQ